MYVKNYELYYNGGIKMGLWHYVRGKFMQRIANRIVMVMLRWLWVLDLWYYKGGKCI